MQAFFIPPFKSTAETTDRLSWLVLLRWLMVLGQVAIIAVGTLLLFIPERLAPWMLLSTFMLGCVNAAVCKSLYLPLKEEWRELELLGILLLDIVQFLLLLAMTQGLQNPFYPLLFVYVTLSAVLLPISYGWSYLTVVGAGVYVMNPVMYIFNAQGTYIRTSALVSWTIQMLVIIASWGIAAAVAQHRLRYQKRWERLQHQQLQLQKVHLLGALGAGVAHEFASPLNTLRLRLDRLQRKVPEPLLNDVEAARKALRQSEERLQALAALPTRDDLATITPLSPQQILLPLWNRYRQQHSHIQWQLENHWPETLVLAVPPLLLQHTLTNLVNNALKALSTVQNPVIYMHLYTDKNRCCLKVTDNGPGWPPIILEHLGEPFLTTHKEGTGLGLYTVFMLAQSMAGEFKLSPSFPKGASAELCLPLPQ
jgi:two-component system, sensor histidine kinase RegB